MQIPPWRSLLALTLSSTLSLFLILGQQGIFKASSFKMSASSIEALARLNQTYAMHVEPLALGSRSLQSSLLSANSLEVWPDNNMGLIVTLDDFDSGMLVLEPKEARGARELLQIGEAYVQAIPEFSSIELDQTIILQGEPVYSWPGFDLMNQDESITLSEEDPNKEVVVGIIDSGLDRKHPFFEDRTILKGYNAVNNKDEDEVGHGTHIAGIIASHSPNAVLAPYKIVSAEGGRLSNVLMAFYKALEDNVDVINTSFGLMNPSPALEKILLRAEQKGVFVVSAAGNNNSDAGFYPATYANAIAVAAVNDTGVKTPKSNYGSWVDVAAPGNWVRSTLPGGRYGYKSGTSQSTAVVSGLLAEHLYESAEAPSLEDVFIWFKNIGTPLTDGPLAGLPIVQ